MKLLFFHQSVGVNDKDSRKDFNIEDEINQIKSQHLNVGAVSTFIGYVRNLNNQKKVTSINLEVYKDMAYKSLEDICSKAREKWDIIDVMIIHRFGKLKVKEKIVLVGDILYASKRKFRCM